LFGLAVYPSVFQHASYILYHNASNISNNVLQQATTASDMAMCLFSHTKLPN